jgi:hypothetical protein
MGWVRVWTYDSEAAGVGDGRGELGVAYPLHATLDNGYWGCKYATGAWRARRSLLLMPRARVSSVLKGIVTACLPDNETSSRGEDSYL